MDEKEFKRTVPGEINSSSILHSGKISYSDEDLISTLKKEKKRTKKTGATDGWMPDLFLSTPANLQFLCPFCFI